VQKPLPSAHAQAFFAALRAERDASASGTVLVFVHGYNQTFDQAVRAAGELRAGLEIDAPVVAYDWPSQGDIAGYAHDEDQARTSATNFIGFITELARQLPGTPIELVAHSMGNRLVTDLIEGGAGAATGTTVRLDHVVMAAPDVFTSQFTSRLRFILSSTGRIAIYASRRDQALLMSSVFHQDPRLGFFEEFPTAIRGMDTIDATDVDTSILGHGYFLDEHTVLFDMRGALADRSPPRSRMERVPIDAQFWYWKLEP
jgi:esterase/lipase superfamily enzyme